MATIWVFLNHEDLRGVHVNTASLARLVRDFERVTLIDARATRPVDTPSQPVQQPERLVARSTNGTGRPYPAATRREVVTYAKAHGVEAASRHYAVSLASVVRWRRSAYRAWKKAKAR